MRRRFDVQLALGQIPIERVRIPLKSRDELPPILAGLQWIFQTPEINEQVLALLESKVLAGKRATGRPGLDLWPILVLGVVRLGLDCDYDRLEDLANHHTLLRQILGSHRCPRRMKSLSTTKLFRRTSAIWMRSCWPKSMPSSPRPGGRCSKKKTLPNPSAPRLTVTCWRPTCISPPI